MKPNPRRSHELQNKARTLLQQNRLPDALTAASEACKQDPGSVDAWFTLAAIYAQRQDFRGIAECCTNVIKHQPQNSTAYFNLGLAQQSMGNLQAAADAYRNALRLQPNYAAAQINLAAALIDLGEAQEALAIADAVLKTSPNMPEVRNIRGNALLKLGQTQAALEWFEDNLKTQNDTPQLLHGAARCRLALGDIETARGLLTQSTQVAPGYAPAWAELGHIARQQEQFAEAAQHYERAARIQPTRENRFNLAHCLFADKRTEPARRLYLELLEQFPDDPLIHNNLGRLYESIGRIEESERHFHRSVELQPGHATPHCNLGRILLGVGKLQAALREFEAAIAIDADNYEGHFGRGQTLVELNDTQAALESFRVAVRINPEPSIAKHYIASLGGDDAGARDSHDYVAGLFDHYADKFDNDLVTGLKYKTPDVLYQALQPLLTKTGASYDILDLGCGTGLCGPLFRSHARHMTGIDLSSQMIEKARERAVYDELAVEDVVSSMQRAPQGYDLIIAADVFVYIGDLSAVFREARSSLRGDGLFAFSTETCDGSGFRIRSSGRHAHSKEYINHLAIEFNFTPISASNCDLRMEYGKPVKGAVYVLRTSN
jgi:predicted TPR repeat methyltransferase